MTKKTSIKKNYFYSTFYQILTLIMPLITASYTARIFGAGGIGIQSYTNSIVSYFTLFAALGTASYGEREIAMHRNDQKESTKLFWEIELLSVITTGISLLLWLAWILISKEYTAYYAVLTITLSAVAFDISWFFSGYEQFKYIVIRNTVFKIIGIIILFVFVRKKSDLLLYVGLIAATGLLGNLSMWTYLPKFLVKIDFKVLRIKRHFKETLAYFIPTIATSVYTVLAKTMIGSITKSTAENGYFEQTTKIINMARCTIFSINTVMSARMSYLFAEGKIDEIKTRINKSFSFIMLLGMLIMFGIIGVSSNFVPWFFGEGYDKVVILLCLMSSLICITGISNCLGSQYFTPSGQRVRSSKAVIIGAGVNFCCNIVLIPMFASIGAAVSSIVGETTISIIYIYMSKGFTGGKMIWSNMWKRLIAGVVMLCVILFVGYGAVGSILITLIQVITGLIVYFVLLIAMHDEFVLSYLYVYTKKIKLMMKR